ncbi:recombination protein NinB [Ramlibacter sp. AN1015]|uniref:recombination protein NinB n=1 Tax=Ramlibacter sp. AN1015 TaxID=3133428 RepID=UPI0030BDBF44
MSKRIFVLQPKPHPARRLAAQCVLNDAPDGYAVTVAPLTRSIEQNAKLWALLHEVSEQVEWYGKRLTPEDWKHLFSASLRKLSVVPNLDGTGFVALGLSTSRMSRAELSELIELIHAFCAERGVALSDEVTA